MLRCQMLRIRERQATQRTKDKNITDGFKALYIKLLIDDGIEFLFRQEITVALCLVKADFGNGSSAIHLLTNASRVIFSGFSDT